MVYKIDNPQFKQSISLIIGTVAALAALSIAYRPPVFPTEGLDPSWMAATYYAFIRGLAFGVDFSFTSGPLAFLYTNYFDQNLYPLMLLTMLLQAGSFFAVCWFAKDRLTSTLLLCAGAVLALPFSGDAIFFSSAFAIFLLILNDRAPRWMVLGLVVTFALPALAKFSFLLIGVALFGLADIARWAEQRSVPRYLIAFLLACFAGFCAAGQPPTAFPKFLFNSLDVALGYSKAMPNFEISLPVFFLAGVIFLSVIAFGSLALTAVPEGRGKHVFRVLGFAGFMFVAFKSATVRIGHDSIAWQTLILAVALLAGEMSGRWLSRIFAMVTASTAIAIAVSFSAPYIIGKPGFLSWRSEVLASQIVALKQLSAPRDMLKAFQARKDEGLRELAAAAPRDLKGSVGSVPWDFAEVIAASYDFRPQPSLQSYSSYTNRLRQKDKEFFGGTNRPDNLLFSLATIDSRYPTMDLGPSLLEILCNYDPVSTWKSGLVLRSRQVPRRLKWEKKTRIPATIGKWASIKSPMELSYLKTRLRVQAAGQIITLAFKQPHLWLDVRFSNGEVISHRFAPSLAESGFVLVPSGAGPQELFRISDGRGQGAAKPVALRLRPMDASMSFAYESRFEWEYRPFHITGPLEHLFVVEGKPVLSALINAKIEKSSGNGIIPEGYFAHSGTRLVTQIQAVDELKGKFGFLDAALKSGTPDPARFSIKIQREDGSEVTAFERVLDPAAQPADRGSKAFALPLSSYARSGLIKLVFEVTPTTGSNVWGWTYWGDETAQTQ